MFKCLFGLFTSVSGLLWAGMAHSEINLVEQETDGSRYLIVEGSFEADYDVGEFLRTVRSFNPTAVSFNSPGGNIHSALTMGRAIRASGLNTIQLRSFDCASACAFAFLGGVIRIAEPGSIGVHRSSLPTTGMTPDDAISAIQIGTVWIIEYLDEMGVDPALLKISLSYGSDDIRYLSGSEMAELRVTTSLQESSELTPSTEEDEYEPPVRKLVEPKPNKQAAIVQAATEPDRIAVYEGVDFYGADVSFTNAQSAGSCARECLESEDKQCRAFTYNTSESAKDGPNCFLKSGMGSILDSNQEAVSGYLLRPSVPDPKPFFVGAIDPITDLLQGVDIPGNDLERSPAGNIQSCRMDCLRNDQCHAFTFVHALDQCWLKRSGEGAVFRDGMVSAYKKWKKIEYSRIAHPN
ncbi:PAN domain-containing protein [Fulvimarina sp. 2208YS6-2-32]|uniref:PAN domain-containing protein n=1 Tax=Fulvimarina uroteuthidis TaxID=3098149 RepID=A0ABU5HYB9_9HYPH|nr:PAN domain-containing protein [Fulvimarina sp. 2208YS6-2-32]MDY8108050.1 PAN domain-containing protein [Fulvimarina sp. 2208YS6-2-32]